MLSLKELAAKYIDSSKIYKFKTFPYYAEFYEYQFGYIRESAKRVLEIGVHKGGSLRAWRDYFYNAEVFGIDVKQEFMIKDEERIQTFLCDQGKRDELEIFAIENGPFDVIVDDGGHMMTQQQISLGVLFRHLVPGGAYAVEDLHSSAINKYVDGVLTTHLLLHNMVFKGYVKRDKTWQGAMTDDEIDFLVNNFKQVELGASEKGVTAVIKRVK